MLLQTLRRDHRRFPAHARWTVGRLTLEPLEDRTLFTVQFPAPPLPIPANRTDTPPPAIRCCPVEPFVSVSPVDPGTLAVSSQNGMRASSNSGIGFQGTVNFPNSNGGDTASVYDSTGRLFWVNLTTAGIGISQVNPTTGAI